MNSTNAINRAVSTCAAITLFSVLLGSALSVRAQDQDKQWKLTKVSFIGLQLQQPDVMTAASGLQIGQTLDLAGIRAATTKLSETGIFKKVASRYQYRNDEVEVIFTVEEAPVVKVACLFDNFVWFSEQEISVAIKRALPEYDGTAATNEYTVHLVKQALARLLQERQLEGEVTHERGEDTAARRAAHLFAVKGPRLTVCAIQLMGVKAELRRELETAWRSHLNAEYSRTESNLFMRAALLPIYQNNGYLKARFASVQGRLTTGSECKDTGVLVTVPIEEGLQYRWHGVVWSGNEAFSAKELEREWKLKPGDIANLDAIGDSFGLAQMQYGRRGFITARIAEQPVFDEAQQRVSYQATVSEGSQFQMGLLTLSGLTESEAKHWQGRWKLKPGAILNTMLVSEFTQELRQDHSIKDFEVKYNPDQAKLTADVVIEIKK